MTDIKELKDEELEKVTGGNKAAYQSQLSHLETYTWYKKSGEPEHIFYLTAILVTYDDEGNTAHATLYFDRYWFDAVTNTAWNHGTCSDTMDNNLLYTYITAPSEIITKYTTEIPS